MYITTYRCISAILSDRINGFAALMKHNRPDIPLDFKVYMRHVYFDVADFPQQKQPRYPLKDEENKNREFFGNAYIENDYIFKRPNGDTYDPSYITHRFGELLKKYDLPHIRFHDLRHSCASLLLSKGCTLKDVQDWMGHADIKMTCNIYGHLDLTRKKVTSEAIRESLAQAC